jgi:hypothetical protein
MHGNRRRSQRARSLASQTSVSPAIVSRAFLTAWIGVNAVFALCHPAWSDWLGEPTFAKSLVVNAVLFVLPALGWHAVLPSGSRALGIRIFRGLVVSTGVFLVCLLIVRLSGAKLTDTLAWNITWVLTNVGFLLAAALRRFPTVRRAMLPREWLVAGVMFVASYGFYYWGATRVVPPLLDHDLELQATGIGLLTRFEPLLISDRGPMDYYFAHPPLLHFYVGGSFLYHGQLESLHYYDDLSRRAQRRRTGAPIEPLSGDEQFGLFGRHQERFRVATDERDRYLVVPAEGGPAFEVPADEVDVRRNFAHFEAQPHLIESRTTNVFFGALTVALLAVWAGRISRRWWLGVLAALAYATGVEVFVRSSYGGYFALGGLLSIMMLLAADRWRRGGVAMLTGVFAGIADHKLVLLPVSYGLQATLRWLAARAWWPIPIPHLFNPKVAGFLLGTAVFWTFGFVIDAHAFIQDHLATHLVDRLARRNPLGYVGYPSPQGLWWEFETHTAYLLVPFAMLLLAMDLYSRSLVRSGSPSPSVLRLPFAFAGGVLKSLLAPAKRTLAARELWLIYIVVSGVAFTIIDWRMTKHLAPLLLPMHLALVPDRDAPKWRVGIAVAVLIAMLGFNGSAIVDLVRDFYSLEIEPGW